MSGGGHGGSPLPGFDAIEGLLHSAHSDRGVHVTHKQIFIAVGVMLLAFLIIAPGQTFRNFEMVIFFAPLWVPILLVRFAIFRFVEANRVENLARQEYVLLEIKMPRDIQKTPLAMETIFTNLHLSPGESTWWKKYMLGATRPQWSFEIASLGGRVHFYVWTRKAFRRGVESFFYAQYPGVQLVEAMDYSRLTDPSHAPYEMWGCDYKLTNKDAYPIRTYVEFMDPTRPLAKPEETIDPLSQIIELFGSLGPQEQLWLQIVIRVSRNEKYKGVKNKSGGQYTWKDEAKEEIERIRKESQIQTEYVDKTTGEVKHVPGFPNPTEGQREKIKAIERSISKPGFDVGMRAIYTAPSDAYQGIMIPHMIGLWKGFHSESYNNFAITRWDANFDDWPWEDPGGHHKAHLEHELVDAYRRRSFFHEPYRVPWFVMNAEELATIFHIPSASVKSPALERIESATSEAPGNLPT